MKTPNLHAYSVKYGFNQKLAASADKAFEWCTDYQPHDLAIMKETGKRAIRKITDDTIILTEHMPKGKRTVTKVKLVRLNKPGRSWTNTHISGPTRRSQFLYRLVPEGKKRSRLIFEGLLICYSRKRLSKAQLSKRGRNERRADSTAWRHLAAALRKELSSR